MQTPTVENEEQAFSEGEKDKDGENERFDPSINGMATIAFKKE